MRSKRKTRVSTRLHKKRLLRSKLGDYRNAMKKTGNNSLEGDIWDPLAE